MNSNVTCWGGAGEVTGANFMLEYGSEKKRARVLIDCGMMQGGDEADERNRAPFPYAPKMVDLLIVTHAHADHIGRIPKLVRDGFSGPIISTPPTRDLAELMFEDARSIMEEEARRGGGESFYEEADIRRTMELWHTHGYGEPFDAGDARATFQEAGHVLGSAMVRLERDGRTLLFSGDIGDIKEPILDDPASAEGAHVLFVESVYGDRLHEGRDERRDVLRAEIEEVRRSGGTLLIPSFAIERTQVLLSEFRDLFESGVPPLPVFLDAPLAEQVTNIYRRYPEYLEPRIREEFKKGEDPFSFPSLSIVANAADSRALLDESGPRVVIAGAGMSEGGRVRAHEARILSDPHSRMLFVGYQAAGTLGRRIIEGARSVSIDRARVKVRANVSFLGGYSGHADRDGLLSFVYGGAETLEQIFVTMGEPGASLFLAQRIRDFLGMEAVVPEAGARHALSW